MGEIFARCCAEVCMRICLEALCAACCASMCDQRLKNSGVSKEAKYSSLGMKEPTSLYGSTGGPKVVLKENVEQKTGTQTTDLALNTHEIQPGETFQGLMLKYNVTREQLHRANRVKNDESFMILGTVIIPSEISETPL